MKIYDISMTIKPQMAVYKNKEEKKPVFSVIADYATNNHYETNIKLDLHTGTHIDAPLHMIENGKTINQYPLNNFISNCRVIDFSNITDKISKEDFINKEIKANEFVILKTKNSNYEEYQNDFVYLDYSGAHYLSSKGIIGVGIDALGIERNQTDHQTHITLLNQGIIILEGLRLKDIEEGIYTLICFPLKIDNVEASLTRAVLIDTIIC